MATITIRLNDTTRSQLEDLARAQGSTLSELVRSTLESLILDPDQARRAVNGRDSVAPRSLGAYERQMLALQHRILAHVMPSDHGDVSTENCDRVEGDPEYQRERARILEGGYVSEYAAVFLNTEPELTAADCEFVMELLDMFRIATHSIQRLRGAGTEVDEELEHRLGFRGFDQQEHDEARLLDYVRHLVDESHWPEFLPLLDREHDGGDSHRPMRATYERLLAAYNAIREEQGLTTRAGSNLLGLDQMQRLAAAYALPRSPRSGSVRRSPRSTASTTPTAQGRNQIERMTTYLAKFRDPCVLAVRHTPHDQEQAIGMRAASLTALLAALGGLLPEAIVAQQSDHAHAQELRLSLPTANMMVLEKQRRRNDTERDLHTIREARKAGLIDRHYIAKHVSPSVEHLLWLPDLVSHTYRRYITHDEDLVTRLNAQTVTIDIPGTKSDPLGAAAYVQGVSRPFQ